MNERDTHFQGFAKLLEPELDRLYMTLYARISESRPIEEIDKIDNEIRTLIARRAYDFMAHVLSEMNPIALQTSLSDEEIIKSIPDLTTWPGPTE